MHAASCKDALFLMLLGADAELLQEANRRSAARVAAFTRSETPQRLVEAGGRGTAQAQTVFIILLYADAQLRREVLEGTALSVRTRALSTHKASRLFENLFANVINGWVRTEMNTPADLVRTFQNEYLVS